MNINDVGYAVNTVAKVPAVHPFTRESAGRARRFHRTFPGYEMTPLLTLSQLAKLLGIASVYVKDESRRFGLNAFKVLGGSYCAGRWIARNLGLDIGDLSYERLVSEEIHGLLGDTALISGESGAAGVGLLVSLLRSDRYAQLKEIIGLDEKSRVLCISTEGDTDRENYRKVVWGI